MSQKYNAALGAYELISRNNGPLVLGVGTGSTTDFFTNKFLPKLREKLKGIYSSSYRTTNLLKNLGFHVQDYSPEAAIDIYIDGADEYNDRKELIKGGGGALTREKILAYSSDIFVCIVDESKYTDLLGKFPLPIEVIEIARSAISRELMKMGGKPIFRNGFISDNGNQIIDIHNLPIDIPYDLEAKLNNIPGVVENGIFANRKADVIICSTDSSVEIIQ